LNTAIGLSGTSLKPFLPTFAGTGSLTANDILAKVDFATGSAPRSVAIGDLDGDGRPDLLLEFTLVSRFFHDVSCLI
jgi:hypothetical protein